ncbi:hypothetical protein NT6N_05880 [Oceaniferula spumae]|uniref:Rhodanese domain-containing protein n=1 Tax=Oceaniferula spumae TaxID=2979115 RepID=A0AAT9FHX5_9BACT
MKAAVAAKKLGYTNIKHMKAGISGWKAAKADVEKGKHDHGDGKEHSH